MTNKDGDGTASTVLVVDDDVTVRDVVRRYLTEAGYTVHQAATGPEALTKAAEVVPDLVVLDLMLPGLDGFGVFDALRAERPVPVIMLTALGEEGDRLAGLELGADDYLTKPFSVRELVARCRAVLRRAGTDAAPAVGPDRLESGGLVVERRARRATLDGEPVGLTTLEFDLLAFLMAHPGEAFTREQLLEHVWGYTIGDTATVTVHIRRVREKVEADATTPTRIATVWGFGYRFDG